MRNNVLQIFTGCIDHYANFYLKGLRYTIVVFWLAVLVCPGCFVIWIHQMIPLDMMKGYFGLNVGHIYPVLICFLDVQ